MAWRQVARDGRCCAVGCSWCRGRRWRLLSKYSSAGAGAVWCGSGRQQTASVSAHGCLRGVRGHLLRTRISASVHLLIAHSLSLPASVRFALLLLLAHAATSACVCGRHQSNFHAHVFDSTSARVLR